MKFPTRIFLAALLLWSARCQADEVILSGNLTNRNDVIVIPITVAAPGGPLSIWTDSYDESGPAGQFNPEGVLWSDGWAYLYAADMVRHGQSVHDIELDTTAPATTYLFTLFDLYNYPRDSSLAGGFRQDDLGPLALVPGDTGFWRIHIEGAASVGAPQLISAVPEPSAPGLLAAGLACLGALGLRARRRRA